MRKRKQIIAVVLFVLFFCCISISLFADVSSEQLATEIVQLLETFR
jgi:hypothetical protein